MGAGIAKTFKEVYPDLPTNLGFKIKQLGNNVYLDQDLKMFSFPTKNKWKEKSSIKLIEKSFEQLIQIAQAMYPTIFVLPFPGIGLGGLTKEQLAPVLKKIENIENIYLIER